VSGGMFDGRSGGRSGGRIGGMSSSLLCLISIFGAH
jgi:hypothetical protein